MLSFIESILVEFRCCFRREATFKWFVVCTVAMMLRSDRLGVTSAIRDLCLFPGCYECLLHFFRSRAYSLEDLRRKWYRVVRDRAPLAVCRSRVILVGDGVKQAKEGRRMPGVKKMAQESETCSKPEYIHGHMFGALGAVVQTSVKRFCMPLRINIQEGLKEASSWEEGKDILCISGGNHIEQMIGAAFEAAGVLGNAYILLDRYFLSKTALRLLDRLNKEASKDTKRIEIITKAKVNCRAYMKPLPKRTGKRGRPPKKGKTIRIMDLFECERRFTKAWVHLYGGCECVSYYCINLLWGTGLYHELRFVLVERRSGERSILVSTDLTLRPKNIIELYGARFSIEESFREMKQQVGAFSYHFWTKSLPKLSHFARKGDPDPLSKVKTPGARRRVLATVKATEVFVLCATVATGTLQMISLDRHLSADAYDLRYLRTKSSKAPSEGTVMYYLRKRIFTLLSKAPGSFITRYIQEKQKDDIDHLDMSA